MLDMYDSCKRVPHIGTKNRHKKNTKPVARKTFGYTYVAQHKSGVFKIGRSNNPLSRSKKFGVLRVLLLPKGGGIPI